VLIRDPQEAFKPQALLSTNWAQTPAHILPWFVRRWTMDVTLEEARAHLGMETPRQGNDRAIARTTPAVLRLYSSIALTAHLLIQKGVTHVKSTAWYTKTPPHVLMRSPGCGGTCGIISMFQRHNRRPT
jgi:hypothetical protein